MYKIQYFSNQITPQIEDYQKKFKELIKQERWENHEIFNMNQISLPIELFSNKVIFEKRLEICITEN